MKRYAPATARNSAAIWAVLAEELPPSGTVLEIASGSGEHAIYFAREFPDLIWQPSDCDKEALASISAWREDHGAANLRAPIVLDAAQPNWNAAAPDAILYINIDQDSCEEAISTSYAACVCINMIHISEWAATLGLFRGCAGLLPKGAPLILYGPFLEDGVETAPSNLNFDRSLKERNAGWGLRNLADVDAVAREQGFERTARVEMPANNLTVVYHL